MQLHRIHSDARGDIMTLTGQMSFSEITLFRTRKGYARGGCMHPDTPEHVCVIEGRIEYHNGAEVFILSCGESLLTPPGTPHYFLSLEDSLVMEWGPTLQEKNTHHQAYRSIVEEINQKMLAPKG